jgi:hypothetical protein
MVYSTQKAAIKREGVREGGRPCREGAGCCWRERGLTPAIANVGPASVQPPAARQIVSHKSKPRAARETRAAHTRRVSFFCWGDQSFPFCKHNRCCRKKRCVCCISASQPIFKVTARQGGCHVCISTTGVQTKNIKRPQGPFKRGGGGGRQQRRCVPPRLQNKKGGPGDSAPIRRGPPAVDL